MLTCPACGQRGIGKVGVDQYYCWDCCVEFLVKGQDVRIFNVLDDGTLMSYIGPIQQELNMNNCQYTKG